MITKSAHLRMIAFLWCIIAAPLEGQAVEAGTQVSLLPAIGFNSDEGVGYGAIAGLYGYDGARPMYRWAFEPLVYFTSEGRRIVSGFLDIPYAFGGRARITTTAYYERDCCQPYFGYGNLTPYDEALAEPPSGPNFYTYRRRRWLGALDVQWRVHEHVRLLTGLAAHHNRSTSRDSLTQFADDRASGLIAASDLSVASFGPKLGIIVDTRDHERDPHRGIWADALIWQGLKTVGDQQFTRWTGTVRIYIPVAPSVTIASRIIGEHVAGDMPHAVLTDIASSFQDFSGLGGDQSVRGVLRNRFLGKTRVIENFELRWRGNQFTALSQQWRFGLVGFVDAGRVWDDRAGVDGGEFHVGKGGGMRITWGEAFIIAVDVAHGTEAGVQTYIGLGHLY